MSAVQSIRDARARLRRPGRWVAVLGVAALLAGCGTVPGAAAEVDGTRISEQSVHDRTQSLIDEFAADPTAIDDVTRMGLNRQQVTDAVRHQLVLVAARDQGITVTPAQVNSFIEQQGGTQRFVAQQPSPLSSDRVPEVVYDYLVLEQLVDRIPAGGIDVTDVQVTADLVPATDRDTAIADRVRYLKDPGAMAADARAGQGAGAPFTLLANPDVAGFGVLTAPEGEIVVLPQGPRGYLVARVTIRSEKPAKLTKDTMASASSVSGYLMLASLVLGKYATDVTVNPRFGHWDPQTLVVVPGNSGL